MSFSKKQKFLSEIYEQVSPLDFYRFLFPVGSFERLGHQEDEKANGLALAITTKEDGTTSGKHTIITDGLEQLPELIKNEEFVIMSPIGYSGRSRKADNARWLYALTLDIDYVSQPGLNNLIGLCDAGYIPTPTFIVNSGHGVHLYYCFDEPLPMYKSVQQEIKKLKTGLIEKAWNKETSTRLEAREALGVVQGFRVVGSKSKIGGRNRLTAFRSGDRISLDYLNEFVSDEYKAIDLTYKARLTKEEAKEKYPEWYQRVVVEKKAPGRWYVKRDLYDWWKRQISTGAVIGHRYFCCMSLAIYANKCGIDQNELLQDLKHFQEKFDALSVDRKEPFTYEEALKVISAFDDDYARYPRDAIARISGIPIKKNKRNFQSQREHLEEARAIRDIRQKRKGTTWQNKNGAPTKEKEVLDYVAKHPGAKQQEIANALGICRQTVAKWIRKNK